MDLYLAMFASSACFFSVPRSRGGINIMCLVYGSTGYVDDSVFGTILMRLYVIFFRGVQFSPAVLLLG